MIRNSHGNVVSILTEKKLYFVEPLERFSSGVAKLQVTFRSLLFIE